MTRLGQAGLGAWGKNLARNFDEIADLAWLCDADESRRREFAARYPSARVTGDFEELLADPELEAVVVATPVPTHYELAKLALEAGKHVFVEKPPAMRAHEMEELCDLAEERDLVLMPGHLRSTTPPSTCSSASSTAAISGTSSACTRTARTSA